MMKPMRNKIINNSVCIAKAVDIALYDYKEILTHSQLIKVIDRKERIYEHLGRL